MYLFPFFRLTFYLSGNFNLINMKTHTPKRIPYLDFLKFFAIASVLLGHSVEQTTGNDFWDNPTWSFIYTYHMPLFMLLCGYFFGSSLKLSFVELIKKKCGFNPENDTEENFIKNYLLESELRA